ncbi:MAG: hypothetical protein PWQ75_1156 [Methanolobus sp.]|jgi:uncharacterized membrane protein YhiD involved in acid resistance|uniref:DUF4956 domain-containing protein n=1 Tax=Methanolobus sp. TaxID=1874737 RepID=UPI00258907CB|nr:DUF4956 domain-containing protein [Methanolobus sp.]MDK2831404.1 hypothetical protein [Methanolobus sp.]
MTVDIESLFNFEDLSGTFTATDVFVGLVLGFILLAGIGWLYKRTHKGTSYTQSYVHTLIMMGLIVDVIMLIVGSNIARAFSLVGALSIIRFRNAVKEIRDIGFIFFAMAIGMATGTKFYMLAIIATGVIGSLIFIMYEFDWFARPAMSQILKIQLDRDVDFEELFDRTFVKYTQSAELIGIDSVRSGTVTELVYSIILKKNANKHEFIQSIKSQNGNQKVFLITGYNTTDL